MGSMSSDDWQSVSIWVCERSVNVDVTELNLRLIIHKLVWVPLSRRQ